MNAPATSTSTESYPRTATTLPAPLSIFPLPLTALERFLFQSHTVTSPMVIRVVLRFSGECLVKSFVETLQQAVFRHPFFRCRVVAQGRSLQWIDGAPAEPVVHRRAGSIFEPFTEPVNPSLDLKADAGLKTEIRCLDDGVLVVMDVHHAVSDGNGMRQLVTDWLHLYHSQVTGTQARLPIMDPDRLQNRHLFPQPSAVEPISLRDGIRNFLVTVRGRTARWISTTRRRSSQTTESSNCVEHVLTDAQYDAVQTRLAAYKVTLNDLMIVSCMSTFARLAPGGADEHRITVLNPTDLRLPSDRLLPATNRFGFAFLRRKRSECLDPARLLAGIHGEMSYVRSNYVGAEFIKGLETASRIPGGVDFFRKLGLFTPSIQWTCLGDVTRGARRLMPWKDGVLSSGGLKLETATGFAPFAENVPISVATCEAGRRLTLTVRSSSLKVTTEETKLFASTLVEQICQFQLP